MKLLLVHLGGIGDQLLALPRYQSLRQLGASWITLLIPEKTKEAVERCVWLDEILTVPKPERGGGVTVFRSMVSKIPALRNRHFNVAINFCPVHSSWSAWQMRCLLWLSGASVTVGRNTDGLAPFYSHTVTEGGRSARPEIDYYDDLVKCLHPKVAARPAFTPLPHTQHDHDVVDHFFHEHHLSNAPVAILPGAGRATKRWPLRRFASLIESLSPLAPIVVIGHHADAEMGKTLLSLTRAPFVNAYGAFTLMELGVFLSRCRLLIANDSGPVHLASLVGIPVVALFGAGEPVRYAPTSPGSQALFHRVACSPCNYLICPWSGQDHLKCLTAIGVDEVMSAVTRLLSPSHGHH